MIGRKTCTLRFLSFIFSFLLLSGLNAQSVNSSIEEGALFIKMKENVATSRRGLVITSNNGVATTGVQALDRVNSDYSVVSMKRVFPYSEKLAEKHQRHGLHLWYEISYDSGVNPGVLVQEFSNLDEIDIAEPVVKKRLITGNITPVSVKSVSSSQTFDDPFLDSQWHYDNDGSLEFSTAGADINLSKAWEIETGKRNVIVNIVDGGFQTDHEDLNANAWVNELELHGEPGVDNDGNGYIDDIYGYNFATGDGHITSHSHGTHVAGTVAAVSNNGVGVAGVAGGSGNDDGIRIMSSAIFTEEGAVGALAAAIVYGADNGAVISQNSWGYTTPGYYEQIVFDAIDYFIAEAGNYEGSPMQGGVVFFAAGNDNSDAAYYPGYYDSAITVGCFGPDFTKSSFSNYGSWVDLCAPGGETTEGGLSHGILSTAINNGYAYMEGTSMACPHVSGIAALVVSKFGGSDFTNEDLKTHIFTSLHNIDEYNPDYEGQLGLGYIDAFLALQTNQEIAPNVVSDLNLVGISQDFANLSWTIPSDEDDGSPLTMEVFYSTEPITEDNIDAAVKTEIDQNLTPGELYEIELTGLLSTTTYYFAVRSADRWGNVSDISNIVSGTTNKGPEIGADVASLELSVSDTNNFTDDATFNILNTAEGTLKWQGGYRTASFTYSSFSTGLIYPLVTESSHIPQVGSIKALNENRIVKTLSTSSSDDVSLLAKNYYDEIYYDDGYNLMIIGEMDTAIMNSSATYYHVDKEDGFNLTSTSMYLKHDTLTGPMTLEVYGGAAPISENLLLRQSITSTSDIAYWHKYQFDEQLFFDYGEEFWIVFHVPSGNLYPLGTAYELDEDHSDNCLMSFDMGESWTTLEEALGGDPSWSWTTTAISQNLKLDNYITLNPDSGVVSGMNQQLVNVTIDGSTLINGDYKSKIVLESNDQNQRYFTLPVSFEISGHKAILNSVDIFEFGPVFYGHEKTDTLLLTNIGYGNYTVTSITSSNPEFEILNNVDEVLAVDDVEIIVKFTPNNIGNCNATLQLEDADGYTHKINLFGIATPPAEIAIDPAELTLPDLTIGDSSSASFNILNTGEYPLNYFISQFVDTVTVDGFTNFHKFGYSVESNKSNIDEDASAVYVWNDIADAGVDITSELSSVLSNYTEVEIGFDFPYYGQKIRSINITGVGALCLDQEGPINSCFPAWMHSDCVPKGYISAFSGLFDLEKSGKVFYHRELESFTVQYQDVLQNNETNLNNTITFQIVLSNNGDIEFIYKDITKIEAYHLSNALIGIGDIEYSDALIVNGGADYRTDERVINQLTDNETIIRLKAPGENIIKRVSEPTGFIAPGETVNISFDVTTDNVFNGDHSETLTIFSNDPFNNPVTFTAHTTVSGGVADLFLERDALNLGSIYQGGRSKDIVILRNQGTAGIDVDKIEVSSDNFTIEGTAPYHINPNASYYVTVNLNTDIKGDFEDELYIYTSDNEVHTVNLQASVTPAPSISVNKTSIEATIDAGDTSVETFTISNNGESPLELAIGGTDWLYQVETAAPSSNEIKDFTYYTLNSNDEGGPSYNWEEIRDSAVHIPYSWYADRGRLYQPIELPWEFEFYQEMCDTMWVSYESFLTLKKPTTEPWYMWPQLLPDTDDPNGVISPYWCPHNPDQSNLNFDEEVGIFYQFFEDRVVITWSEFVDFFGMGSAYSIQAILYKNGNIKFQYKSKEMSVLSLGVVGVENMDGTDGVQIASYNNYIENNLAVSLVPTEKYIIEAGESLDVSFVLDATYLNKGDFEGNIRILNNTPTAEEFFIPVTLSVSGVPNISTVDSINFGNTMIYEVETEAGAEYNTVYQEFSIRNSGRADIDFSRILLEDQDKTKLEWQVLDTDDVLVWEGIPRSIGDLVPNESLKLRVGLTPDGDAGSLSDNVIIRSNVGDDMYIPITAEFIHPPVNTTLEDSIIVKVNDKSSVETRQFVIDNTDGQWPLDYEITFSFMRDGASVSTAALNNYEVQIDPKLLQVSDTVSYGSSAAPLSEEEGYNNTLEYSTDNIPYTQIGYGEELSFSCSTAFTAPPEGFNLTHVETWYNPGLVLNSNITIEVRGGGTSISDSQLLTTQLVSVTEGHGIPEGGSFVTIELDENQIFYPYESFYVVFKYQLGVVNPQGIVAAQEYAEGRYMYESDGVWYDLQFSYPDWGWMVKAHESEANGGVWASLLEETIGQVPVGESQELTIEFNGANTLEYDNKGQLKLTTNDPINTESNIGLLFSLNQGPKYQVVDNVMPLPVNENDTLTQKIYTWDSEGDACTYTLQEEYDNVEMSLANDTITFVYKPDYEASGLRIFKIVGEDSFGNQTVFDVDVSVRNVNRDPVIVNPIADKEYRLPTIDSDNIDLSQVFNDPDGQELSYEIVDSENDHLVLYLTDHMFSILPVEVCAVQLNIKATDPDGASVTHSFIVDVLMRVGLGDTQDLDEVTIFPNPIDTKLNVVVDNAASEYVKLTLYNVVSNIIYEKEFVNTPYLQYQIDMTDYPSGLYFVHVQLGDRSMLRKIVKK